jgi:hypothetical protein
MRCLPHRTGAIKNTANSVPQFMLRRNRAAPGMRPADRRSERPKEYRRYLQLLRCFALTAVPAGVILSS